MPAQPSPLVSVIVPVYNAERYLPYCVDSILGQSHANLDVILVDDGATDRSPTICDDYAARDPRVTVIHQTNGGIAKAQNAGLDAARGAYVAFADNDDILDRRNIELLLHAIESTGADMSKARWRQFGVSQLNDVTAEARRGADDPSTITVFRDPLRAYQTVFCKTLRLLGDRLGRRTEARYFNEANWCRLYRRELWDGVRFPEGMYAQDVMVAGRLYERMGKVADIDATLYFWLQSAGSVTHRERSAAFYHDNVEAGIVNFRLALAAGVTPARSYYTMVEQLGEAAHASGADEPEARRICEGDARRVRELIAELSPAQRFACAARYCIRLAEKHVYDLKVKNMR
ncbi:glycosyltransferase family 2 protein [Bifidobacterium biavatii]|uniref:Glycosyltransferase involved in cell wall biogenesis n=1 Tax=Bifidobacterium biavatii DSM 23969 TaxID=1437608 RepID=A0A086ZN01_9BIFI|nr:glycosyltransferase [Bifidobacterium biavatii]KFI47901.1 glycosyltransferase involved in cell wall biogenesis [Bifidobacterium biavatii DSM 23969]